MLNKILSRENIIAVVAVIIFLAVRVHAYDCCIFVIDKLYYAVFTQSVNHYEENLKMFKTINKKSVDIMQKHNKFLALKNSGESIYDFNIDLSTFKNSFVGLAIYSFELNEKKQFDRSKQIMLVLEELISDYIIITKTWEGPVSCANSTKETIHLDKMPLEVDWALKILFAFFPGENSYKKLNLFMELVKAANENDENEILRLEQEIGFSKMERKYFEPFQFIAAIISINIMLKTINIEDFKSSQEIQERPIHVN